MHTFRLHTWNLDLYLTPGLYAARSRQRRCPAVRGYCSNFCFTATSPFNTSVTACLMTEATTVGSASATDFVCASGTPRDVFTVFPAGARQLQISSGEPDRAQLSRRPTQPIRTPARHARGVAGGASVAAPRPQPRVVSLCVFVWVINTKPKEATDRHLQVHRELEDDTLAIVNLERVNG